MGKRLPRGFYWRGGVVWARTDPITGKPCSTGCRSSGAARLWREEREKLAVSPHYAASLSATIGRWITRTIDHKRSRGKHEGTIHMYEVKLGHVARIFGKDNPMATITPTAVDDYVQRRQSEGVVNNTIARELTCLRQMLRLARRAGEFALVPEEVMPVQFEAKYVPIKRTMPADQLPRLLAALSEPRRAWVAFLVATAGDVSDAERARPEDYDPVTETVFMRGTKNAARNVAIPVLPWFRELFLFAHSHLPLEPWGRISKDLPAMTDKLGIGHITPKDLRRSVSTWLIEAGVNEATVSRFMRHKNTTMVRTVYGQVKPAALGSLISDQLQSKNVTPFQRPLGGMADAGDLKGVAATRQSSHPRALPGVTKTRKGPPGTERHTETLHRSPAVWALALAAERMGVLT